ncbi:hypothetical protein Nepgr_025461 [Nepenthes gracilis]|uniref:RecA-like N-terminal domain-containing protein n=1 Tax=Nepenthes gracilis TaxID=150966 RepID=A0AAD3T6D3_NEPGR|nr:hypothetical protein Nepgr_025461 [Nepenthes gracilis]
MAGAKNVAQFPVVLVENSIVIVMLVEDHLWLQSKLYCGKTTLILHMIAVAQTLEENIMLLEAEHTLNTAYPKPFCGDVEHIIICQPDKEEMAFELADSLCRSGAIHQICVDSVLALTPRAEIGAKKQELTLAKVVDAMAQSLESSITSESKREKQCEYENNRCEKCSAAEAPSSAKTNVIGTVLAVNSGTARNEPDTDGSVGKFDALEEDRMLTFERKITAFHEILFACLANIPEGNKRS